MGWAHVGIKVFEVIVALGALEDIHANRRATLCGPNATNFTNETLLALVRAGCRTKPDVGAMTAEAASRPGSALRGLTPEVDLQGRPGSAARGLTPEIDLQEASFFLTQS